MSECGWLSDRLPALVRGRAEWTPQESQHLNGCRSCQEELKVLRIASQLGQGVANSLDSEALGRAVLGRVQHDRSVRQGRRRIWTLSGLAAAAAIVMAVWTGTLDIQNGGDSENRPLAAAELEIPLPELETLQPAELDSVLQTMDEASAGRDESSEEPELGDLNSDELERVLDSWEG